jgi:hypothetical protein
MTDSEIKAHAKELEELRLLLSDSGKQIIAPCLGGIANFETRDIGTKTSFREGPEWMWRGKVESCKDTYTLREIPISDLAGVVKIFECTERCVMSDAPVRSSLPYLNQASLEHLLRIFAHEYITTAL